ncbi:MAG: ferredoxin [Spirulina sp. SIO3F2]|nr:ferredoxin [Spirulina sp. SIO3F2]
MTAPPETLNDIVISLGIPQISRHIFLCADQTKPKCCPKDESITVWNHLKARLKELGLDTPTDDRPSCIFRTKANCLRVCAAGPILVVYPDGVWYRNVTVEVCDRIIEEHLLQNQVVEEYVLCTHPLPPTDEQNSPAP